MNYPPGMTREHWKHIDGEQHYVDCPMHEDNWESDGTDSIMPADCECAEIAQAIREIAMERKNELYSKQ